MTELFALFIALGLVSFAIAIVTIAIWIFVIFVYPHVEGLVVTAEDLLVSTVVTCWRHIRTLQRRWFRSAAARCKKKKRGTHGARRG